MLYAHTHGNLVDLIFARFATGPVGGCIVLEGPEGWPNEGTG